jgi:hypothetical protein
MKTRLKDSIESHSTALNERLKILNAQSSAVVLIPGGVSYSIQNRIRHEDNPPLPTVSSSTP